MTTTRRVVVVCSGNICRSPMGEAMLREHLRDRGLQHVEVSSAGTDALVDHAAMTEAVNAVAAIRGDARQHRARQLDLGTARDADLLLCATTQHRKYILSWWPDLDPVKVCLFNDPISGNAPVDVDDPYGWDQDVFHLAARVIDRSMDAWADILTERWSAD